MGHGRDGNPVNGHSKAGGGFGGQRADSFAHWAAWCPLNCIPWLSTSAGLHVLFSAHVKQLQDSHNLGPGEITNLRT